MKTTPGCESARRPLLAVVVCAVLVAQPGLHFHTFASNMLADYDDVRPILNALVDILPSDLKSQDELSRRKAWTGWAIRHDRDIRARLASGDEDTIVNWLLFGTSFTSQPRALHEVPATSEKLPQLISARIKDLISALASNDQDERRVFARQLLRSKGYGLDSIGERTRLEQHLHAEV